MNRSVGKDLKKDFVGIYQQCFPVLMRVAYHITGSQDAAEDLCQEAFIRYYQRHAPLPDAEQAKYWLIRVVKNLSINYIKRSQRERSAFDKIIQEPKRDVENGESKLIKKETQVLVETALQQLPEKLKIPLIMREYSGLTYREIAKTLRITEGNVKIRIYRARKTLESIISKEDVHVS